MSSDEWITDDGINYYPLPEQEFNTSYAFDDEGLRMYADGMDDPAGSITWRAMTSTGGDAYAPSNMRLEVDRDKEIVLGFKGDTEVDSIRFSKVNGFPQIFADNTEGVIDTISVKAIEFLDSAGQKTGAKIVSNDYGELIVTHKYDGQFYNSNLGSILMSL